jgi:hypothetical protein
MLHPAPYQQLTVPSLAELLGFGNLQLLLLMEDQQQHLQPQKQQPQHTSNIRAQLDALQSGDILLTTSPKWTGLEQCSQQRQQQQPTHMSVFRDACADAEAVQQQHDSWEDHRVSSCSSNRRSAAEQSAVQLHCQPPDGGWSVLPGSSNEQPAAAWQQQLRLLLQQHAEISEEDAAACVQVCVELQEVLLQLEALSAAAAGREPQLPAVKVLRKASDAAAVADDASHTAGHSSGPSSSSSASSSNASSIAAVAVTCSAHSLAQQGLAAQHCGPLAYNGLATVLVRLALARLPGQQPEQAAAGCEASSSSSSSEVVHAVPEPACSSRGPAVSLQEQLLSRVEVLGQLLGALKQALAAGEQVEHASKHSTEQQRQCNQESSNAQDMCRQQQEALLQLLYAAGCGESSADEVVHTLQELSQQQLLLQLPMRQVLTTVVAAGDCGHSDPGESCCRAYLAVGRMLADVFAPDAMSLIAANLSAKGEQQQQQQQQQLINEHRRIWAPGFSSSSNSSSSSCDASTTEHLSLQQQQRASKECVHQPPGAIGAAAAATMHCSNDSDPATINQLLDAAEAATGRGCASLLLQCLHLIASTSRNASHITAWQARAQRLLLLLCNSATTNTLWLQRYKQHWQREAAAVADVVQRCGNVLADVAMQLEQVLQAAYEASQKARADWLLCSKLHERLAAADRDLDVGLQQQSQLGAAKQRSSSAASSSSSSVRFIAAAGETAGAAAAAAATVPVREQLLDRLLLHAATAQVTPGAALCGDHMQAVTAVSKAVEAALIKASRMKAVLQQPPAAPQGSMDWRPARAHVEVVLRGFSSLIAATADVLARVTEQASPFRTMLLYGNVTGLGLLARLGLWQPPQDSKGLGLQALGSSDGSDTIGGGRLSCCAGAAGASEHQDGFAEDSDGVSAMLLLYADAIDDHDSRNLGTLLSRVCQQPGQGSSAADVGRWISSGFARGSLEQLVQQHGHHMCSAAAATAAAAAPAAAQQGTSTSAAVAAGVEGAAAAAQHMSALWGLLLATKPSLAVALHCSSIPAACRSYEALERAVLSWPLQPEPAAAAVGAAAGLGTQGWGGRTQQRKDSSSSSCCICGAPGYAFSSPRPDSTSARNHDSAELFSRHGDSPGSQQRAVCGEAACVAHVLQQLAQQGPPAGDLDGERFQLAMQHVAEDLLLLDDEYR